MYLVPAIQGGSYTMFCNFALYPFFFLSVLLTFWISLFWKIPTASSSLSPVFVQEATLDNPFCAPLSHHHQEYNESSDWILLFLVESISAFLPLDSRTLWNCGPLMNAFLKDQLKSLFQYQLYKTRCISHLLPSNHVLYKFIILVFSIL